MKKIFLTGASGFLGGAVIRRLCTDGLTPTAALRQASLDLPSTVITYLINGIESKTSWSAILRDIDVVVHCAARVHVMRDTTADPLKAFRSINVDGTLNLARQAAEAGVSRFVFISSIGVNGMQTEFGMSFSEVDLPNPHNDYSLSKWEAEQGLQRLACETGMEVVIIRPPLVYGHSAPGNFGTLKRAVQLGWPLPLGCVNNKRSLVALDNLVDFIITCINQPEAANQTFLVSDGQDLSTIELVSRMAQVLGVPARLLPVPLWALQAAASLLGKGDEVNRLCGNLQVNISKARSLLDWKPQVSVDEGLKRAMRI